MPKQLNLQLVRAASERFWSKVDQQGMDDCWLWTAGCFSDGYGAFWIDNRTVKAHRIALLLATDSWDQCLLTCHSCDNPRCCNPRHLFSGTEGDNQRDMRRKGRGFTPHGSGHPLSKLTDDDIHQIRASTETHAAIAHQFNINQPLVTRIKKRTRWAHVPSM